MIKFIELFKALELAHIIILKQLSAIRNWQVIYTEQTCNKTEKDGNCSCVQILENSITLYV